MVASVRNLALLVLFAAAVVGSSAKNTYQVLDSFGWSIPNGGAATYTAWAANKSFTVGDTLVFNYTSGTHNVAEVTKQAFDNCNATNPITLNTTGPTRIPLDSAGDHYFICTFPGHCTAGQKLAVNVSAASGSAPAPAPGSRATPTPASAPAPAPAATSTPPPAAAPSPAPETATGPSPSSTAAPSPSTTAAPSPSTTTPSPPASTGSATPPSPGSPATSLKATGLLATILSIAVALLY